MTITIPLRSVVVEVPMIEVNPVESTAKKLDTGSGLDPRKENSHHPDWKALYGGEIKKRNRRQHNFQKNIRY